ncbi:MAG: MASE1 domain-containing protein [Alphaproteobacteria bacterium]|nr:MASE1 domain-containing protein [Alphaproteobacteria bacterium]
MAVSGSQGRGLGIAPVTFSMLLLIAAVVFVGSWAGLLLTNYTGRIAAIWISNAVAVAAALKTRSKDFPALLMTAFAANLLADLAAGDPLVNAVALSLANIVEIALVVTVLRRLKMDRDFSRPKTLLIFYGLALGPAPVASALFAGSFLHLTASASLWQTAREWYVSDALDLIILVPPLVTVRFRDFAAIFSDDERTLTLVLIGLLAVTIVVNMLTPNFPLAFLFFPVILLMTFVRGFAGGTVGLLVSGVYLLVPVLLGYGSGSIAGHSLPVQIVIVQIFGAVLSFTVVLAGAMLEERRRLENHMADAVTRAEEARIEALVARDAAETANRTKSMFLANMSHELRTPLNAVIGFSELMRGELYGPLGHAKYREYVQLVHDAGSHLLDLINDVLDMSKIEAGKFEIDRRTLDLCQVVAECVTLMAGRAADAGVELSADIPASSIMVCADRRALKQILLNLLSNGLKFTPAGGTVRVFAAPGPERFVFGVQDSGIGIPHEALEKLGQPFMQLRESASHTHKGTGLGLALVRSLARLHGGNLQIESRQGAGTTATVEIPLEDQDAVGPAAVYAA